ncbi:N-acetyl-1-D-myo-inositol-2-amino-2-deoxy-alpha-D-glucopyranoside deacetylase [Microbacterium sp. W4I4]|uniref:N-acetyl-1-D-myo-inositol-2-amino-2-deoxy-alpha- D-glucopyranoside deacetylase n=1 Tax=Microbacterium sp. W4I4 TaxID=3042295 RepID=UPI0027863E92|nr:N-acetyl-1-D-myo-inositol-2-amino-2-deoxy-alpha-D-glucopyranoside deacetylase [Microbacterium sp. W4I4]MDQ0614758.1 N-acetyl-1-D-myo-inositol-2-amino-2-deoxy-alpha-D-glucopyranoside deacetylase [Microbacterium sp. W4I4]
MAASSHVLLAHAHPDDESCATGGTIARLVAEGHGVTVVTSTQGEQGRIAVPELQHLHADEDDQLGPERAQELAGAVSALGVTDHRYLGGAGRYRDSGRMGIPANDRPDAFWQADLDEAGLQMAEIIREVRPQAVITYDPNGGYGHPDHIQTHRVAMRGVELAADPTVALDASVWDVPLVYWTAVPRELIVAELTELARHADELGLWVDPDPREYPDGVHDDAAIDVEFDVSDHLAAKTAALACHRTQLTVKGAYWVLASGRGMRIQDREWFIRVKGGHRTAADYETSLLPEASRPSDEDR